MLILISVINYRCHRTTSGCLRDLRSLSVVGLARLQAARCAALIADPLLAIGGNYGH